ncbi:Asp23/Gls24 family envelope stress response protein [Aerococcus sanguinicola]|uniref:Asp23/Gls24 family envelope stress response protein n=1 Tax=Aerococcus sanguinicola TaxID=119206 RepID=A0A109RDJ3_9LACT|nr:MULTISPECIES: Asp23/Gls24 family envelope stress response protein [Aerococcus]AMB94689.1 hypothetical protein AWM72_07935 [Aerococcus sanguinicola]MDK6232764.1 Asp23/Gls24 family envelope stress response protein [Aerococcus sp. UMB10185]MDK6805287.1 Asp23/Gls24 family envelope stress response protein [Aerococcus sp. UMB7834]MDK6854946.1 Asp23/Gls24 family envelope stress response protein [Aerococcus sp. UMB7533]MDK7050900.1 Asp23/Gls24 family envelope stress response protein [Aerococcus san
MAERTGMLTAEDQACLGSFNIAPKVIEDIASQACRDFEEVNLLSSWRANFNDWMNRDQAVILYQNEDHEIFLEIALSLKYGVNVPETMTRLQQHVFEEVYFMTDVQLDAINIKVTELNI